MTSSSVVATAPRIRISAAAPSTIRCRVARPFGVSLRTAGSAVAVAPFGLTGPNFTPRARGKCPVVSRTRSSLAGMGFLKPDLPVVDFAEWSKGPRAERTRPLARHWAEVGFGTPVVLHLFYVV